MKVLVVWVEKETTTYFFKLDGVTPERYALLKSFHGEYIDEAGGGYSDKIRAFFLDENEDDIFEDTHGPIEGEVFDLIIMTGILPC